MGRRIVKYLKNWLSGLLLVATSATAFSQNSYPVHVSVQALPPYGVYLSDYYSGTRDRLIVTLLNRDQGQNVLQVKLRVTVKNGSSLSLRSRDELYYPVITLERGIPLRLTNSDLVPYLAPDRIAMNGYLQNGKLPAGMTEFSVQAFDHATGRPLSDISTGRAWLEIKQPPMLDLPAKDELVASRTPQYIRFQWMPRHQGLASTMYEFTLKELPDNGAAPQSAYLYGNTVYQTQTRFTTINYTHLEPLLTPGRQYGWQVRAIALDGVDEIGMFENNGYSEVGWFRIGDNCPPVTVTAQAGYRKMTLQWRKLPEHMAFVVEYRLKSEHDFYEWTSEQTFDNEFIAYQLTPGYRYEYRVGAMGMTQQQPVFSPVGEITLPMDNEDRLAKCGMKPVIDFDNQEPKENLVPGDIVIIGGDFPMTLTQVSPQGNGWYSGKGWITMPWIFEVDVAVKFSRLRINTDNRQIGGEVETETDPKASQIANLNELDYGGNTTTEARRIEFPAIKLDFTIPDIPAAEFDPEKGEVIIYDTNGEPHIVATQQNGVESVFPMIVEDKEGNKYQIDAPEADKNDTGEPGGSTTGSGSGGKQTLVVTPIKDIPGTFDTTKLNADGGIVVQFSRGGGEFAFDAGAEPWYQTTMLLRQYYAPFGTYGDNVDYVAAWKFIPTGENDTVEARIVMGETDAANILFVLKDGTGIAAKHDGGKWTLSLPAVSSGETYEVYAIYNGKNRQYTVGKLNVVSYGKQQRTVTLVPVDAQVNDVGGLERELNTIYKPYGISIKVEIDESIYDNIDWDSDGDGKLNLNGSGFFSKETGEMKALRTLYQRESTYKKDSYYIFVMGDAVANEEPDKEFAVQGDMPRGKQFGYIFSANIKGALSWFVAHELGHGMFTLLHSFDVNYSGDKYKSQTANLMDYASGTDLAAFQWNIIANPAPLTWFDSEEDGMASGVNAKSNYAILVSDKPLETADIKDKTIDEIQKTNNVYLISCDEQINEILKNSSKEYTIPQAYIYYFGEKPVLKLYPVSVKKDGKLSISSAHTTDASAVYFNVYVNEASEKIQYKIIPQQFNSQLAYNSSNDISAKKGTSLSDEKPMTIYGLQKFEYQISYGKDSQMFQFIKSVRWNEEDAKVSGLSDWILAENINTQASGNKITVTPLFGQPVVYTINYKPAPVLTVAKIGYEDGSVGLDNWQIYKDKYSNSKIAQKYTEKFTAGNKEYYLPTVLLTKESPATIPLTLEVADNGPGIEGSGLCLYKIEGDAISKAEYVSSGGDGEIYFEIKNPEKNSEVSITDMQGNLKGKIQFKIIPITGGSYNYRIVRFKYVDAQNKEHMVNGTDIGYLNNAYAQLGIVWKEVNNEIMTINDSDISRAVTAFGSKISINAEQVKKYLSGTPVDENAKEDYHRVLIELYNKKITGTNSKICDVVFMPHDIGPGGFTTLGSNFCFIGTGKGVFTVAHELGHDLGLSHIGTEFGLWSDDPIDADKESSIKTNNIMGYGAGRYSFWLWQKDKMRKLQ